MAMPVLATKLFIPPPRPQAVHRPRLVERLEHGLRSGRSLSLISAPAGFGKTSLLSEWVAESRRRDPERRFAWLSLDGADNDPVRFLSYLAAALHRADPTAEATQPGVPASVDSALTALINEIAFSPHHVVLVLDDFQLIEDAAISDAVAFLLDNRPATLHLVIATRSDPRLPLARMRATGELTELRAADLRFTDEEAAVFLRSGMGLDLSSEDVAALDRRTEGWIAGLQLAALSMRGNDDVSDFIAGFTGSHRFVIDYLVEEVLQRQPPDVRDFLLDTAILERLSGPLCDAVSQRTGGSAMLEMLERANLFVVPLDDRREWYRYHRLFADVLQARLRNEGPARTATLHRRASEWFEHDGAPEDAVRHALAASDFPRAGRLIEALIPSVRKSRQDATLLAWLAGLPDETIGRRPVLGVFSAWSSLVSGDIMAAGSRLTAAERVLSATTPDGTPTHDSEDGEELRRLPVTIALYRAAISQAMGDSRGTAEHAQRALDLTAPDDHLGRGAAAGLLGLASWAEGNLEGGVRAFGEARTSLRLAGNLTDTLSTTLVLADMLIPLGRLRETQVLYDEALALALARASPGDQPTADLHAGIAELFRERNELAAATEHLAASEALEERAFSHEHRYRWFVAMAGVRQAEGRLDDAHGLLVKAEQSYLRGFFPEVRPISGMMARIRIIQRRLTDAEAWVEEQGLSSDDDLSYLREFGHITMARLLIARGDAASIQEAMALLDRLLGAAEAGGRTGTANEILVLQALALSALGETPSALVPLERALTQAEPEGYARLFLDEGLPMLALLRSAAGDGIRPEYVRQLSQALRHTEDAAPGEALSDPLSERELHVLRLLATDLTGPEIARELYVSLNTMRTHTKHIFVKLGVNTRPAAVRRGEALGLI